MVLPFKILPFYIFFFHRDGRTYSPPPPFARHQSPFLLVPFLSLNWGFSLFPFLERFSCTPRGLSVNLPLALSIISAAIVFTRQSLPAVKPFVPLVATPFPQNPQPWLSRSSSFLSWSKMRVNLDLYLNGRTFVRTRTFLACVRLVSSSRDAARGPPGDLRPNILESFSLALTVRAPDPRQLTP